MEPLIKLSPRNLVDSRFSVRVWPYLLGQYRIQLVKDEEKGPYNERVVRECCTYVSETCLKTLIEIQKAPDAPAYLESLAKPYNCEGPGGRIRLDNKPEDRIDA